MNIIKFNDSNPFQKNWNIPEWIGIFWNHTGILILV